MSYVYGMLVLLAVSLLSGWAIYTIKKIVTMDKD